MSFSIPQNFVEQFSANVHMLVEQRASRLRSTVMIDSITGESAAIERIGTTQDTPNVITTRHSDTPLNETPHSRRWVYPIDYDVADLIDNMDRAKLLINPDSAYTIRHAGVMGRGIDDSIIAALGGSAKEGKAATSTVALPAGQKIASGSTGLTIAKLIEAKEILDAAEVDPFYPRYLGHTARQLSNLLNDPKATSVDFNTIRALVKGEINEFLGFTFVRCERFLKPSTDRLCYAWAQPGVQLRIAVEPNSVAASRPDKRMAQQIYTSGSWGAVRVEDEMVVEVACAE